MEGDQLAKRKKKPQPEAFVLDGSVCLAWCFHDEASAYADAVAARFPAIQALVPSVWPLEVANALLMGERRKRSTEADTVHWLEFLRSLPVKVDDETQSRAWSDTLSLARTHRLSVYDAAYLELALRRGLPLATLDDKLKDAAVAVGIADYKP
jgi:predicted nucleic acid-binding protein